MFHRVFVSLCLLALTCACTPNGSSQPNTATSAPFLKSPSEIQTALITHIQTKGKTLAKPIIEALATYHTQHQSYPKSLSELGIKDLITHFHVTDFKQPRHPEIEGSVYHADGPVSYELRYETTGPQDFSLFFHYSVYGMTGLSYSGQSGEWRTLPTYF